jgi:hypothetical protein
LERTPRRRHKQTTPTEEAIATSDDEYNEVGQRSLADEEPALVQIQTSELSTESDIDVSSRPLTSTPSPEGSQLPSPVVSSLASVDSNEPHSPPSYSAFSLRPAIFTPASSPVVPALNVPNPVVSAQPAPTPTAPASLIIPLRRIPPPVMAEVVFYGDHTDAARAQEWIRGLRREFRKLQTTSDADKIGTFEDWLGVGSVAETWYKALPAAERDTWEHLEASFTRRWPPVTTPTETIPELAQRLLAEHLPDEEVGEYVDVRGRRELGHVAWANRVSHLFTAIGTDPTGVLINQVRRALPDTLRNAIPTRFSDHNAFLDAVRAVDREEIERQRASANLVRALSGLHITPAAFVTQPAPQLTPQRPQYQPFCVTPQARFAPAIPATPLPHTGQPTTTQTPATVRAPAAPTRSAPLAPNLYQTPGRPTGQTHLFAGYTTPAPSTRAPQRPPIQQRYMTLTQNMVRPHDTVDEYNKALRQWHRDYEGLEPDENRPYPLRPNTSEVGKDECFKCGLSGHFAAMCPNPTGAPTNESHYRAIAGSIFRQAGALPGRTATVRYASASKASTPPSTPGSSIPQMREDGTWEWVHSSQGNVSEQGQ